MQYAAISTACAVEIGSLNIYVLIKPHMGQIKLALHQESSKNENKWFGLAFAGAS
jgi:hypothetical protein